MPRGGLEQAAKRRTNILLARVRFSPGVKEISSKLERRNSGPASSKTATKTPVKTLSSKER